MADGVTLEEALSFVPEGEIVEAELLTGWWNLAVRLNGKAMWAIRGAPITAADAWFQSAGSKQYTGRTRPKTDDGSAPTPPDPNMRLSESGPWKLPKIDTPPNGTKT